MSDARGHLGDELHEALDGRLSANERQAVEMHLTACSVCRARFDALAAAKAATAGLRDESLPADLRASLLDAVRRESLSPPDEAKAWRGPARAPAWSWGLAAAALLALAIFVMWPRSGGGAIVAAAAADYRAYRAGQLALEAQTASVADVEEFFRRADPGFQVRVFDLAMMRFAIEGGRVHRLGGRLSVLFVYRGPSDERIVCQMYQGLTDDLPEPTTRRSHDGIAFQVYDRNGLTLVFWQEGDVVCVLVGEGPAEAIVQLAFAKAMKV